MYAAAAAAADAFRHLTRLPINRCGRDEDRRTRWSSLPRVLNYVKTTLMNGRRSTTLRRTLRTQRTLARSAAAYFLSMGITFFHGETALNYLSTNLRHFVTLELVKITFLDLSYISKKRTCN